MQVFLAMQLVTGTNLEQTIPESEKYFIWYFKLVSKIVGV